MGCYHRWSEDLPNNDTLNWERGQNLLGSKLGGPGGTDLLNMVPETKRANNDMRVPDGIIEKAATGGQTVLVDIRPVYTGNNYYPDYIEYTADGTTATGGVGIRLQTMRYNRPIVKCSVRSTVSFRFGQRIGTGVHMFWRNCLLVQPLPPNAVQAACEIEGHSRFVGLSVYYSSRAAEKKGEGKCFLNYGG